MGDHSKRHAIANGLPLIATNRVGVELDPSGAIKGVSLFLALVLWWGLWANF